MLSKVISTSTRPAEARLRREPLEQLLREGRELGRAGKYAEAQAHFELLSRKAIELREYDLAARGLGSAGACQFGLHRYRDAVRSLLEAHRLAERAGDPSGAAMIEANLASLYSETGELDAAVQWTERSLRRISGKDRSDNLAQLAIQMGSFRARQGRLAESAELFRQGIQAADRTRNYAMYAVGWNRLGEELMRHGDYPGAERAFLEAFRVRSVRGFPLAGSYLNLAKAKLYLGELVAASELLDRAAEGSTRAPIVPARDVYRVRGQVKLREGRWAEALDDLRVAMRLERAWRWSAPAADAARIGAEGMLAELHGALIEAGNRLYQQTRDRALIRETFEAAEENRATSLRALLHGNRSAEDLPPSYWEAAARLQRAELAALASRDPKSREAADEARADLVRLEAGIEGDTVAPPSSGLLPAVQAALEPGSAMLSFHLGDTVSWLWVVDAAGISLHALPGREEIRPQVKAAAAAIQEDRDAAGSTLYSTLFGRLPQRILNRDRWLLALDTDLFDAPVAALVDSSGQYLAERHTIGIISGAGAWVESRSARTGEPAPLASPSAGASLFVGIGDPIYNTADPRFRSGEPVANGLLLPRLVGSGKEVEACAQSWGGEQVLLRGADVTRDNLAAQLRRNPAVIHFATHFLESSERSGAAMIPLGIHEVLPAAEISHWKIHAGLVALSGCRSAAGAAWRGTGLMGLTRAWLSAGARSVVGSRWATPDEDGALFRALYRNLRGTSRVDSAAALRAAQLEMLHGGGWRARPAYWGAYFAVGNQ